MTQHTQNSSYREKLIEHLFIGELLKLSWLHHSCDLEISKPEVDNSGYDVIAEVSGCIRHIQIKTSIKGGKTASQKVHTKLSEKPSGCVVWVYFDPEDMKLGPFLYFGDKAGKPMRSISDRKTAKHTKGNKDGFKAERQNLRVLNKGDFNLLSSIDAIYTQLFQVACQSASGNG